MNSKLSQLDSKQIYFKVIEDEIFIWVEYPESKSGMLKRTTWTPKFGVKRDEILQHGTIHYAKRTKNRKSWTEMYAKWTSMHLRSELFRWTRKFRIYKPRKQCLISASNTFSILVSEDAGFLSSWSLKWIKAAWHPIRRMRTWKKRADAVKMRSKILIVATWGDPMIKHAHYTSSFGLRLRFPCLFTNLLLLRGTRLWQARPRVPFPTARLEIGVQRRLPARWNK